MWFRFYTPDRKTYVDQPWFMSRKVRDGRLLPSEHTTREVNSWRKAKSYTHHTVLLLHHWLHHTAAGWLAGHSPFWETWWGIFPKYEVEGKGVALRAHVLSKKRQPIEDALVQPRPRGRCYQQTCLLKVENISQASDAFGVDVWNVKRVEERVGTHRAPPHLSHHNLQRKWPSGSDV